MNKIYGYSFDKETYEGAFSTEREAIEDAVAIIKSFDEIQKNDLLHIGIGEMVEFSVKDGLVDAESVIDKIRQYAIAGGNDFAEDYLDNVSDDQLKDLEKVLNSALIDWLAENNLQPTWYNVEKSKTYTVDELKKEWGETDGNDN